MLKVGYIGLGLMGKSIARNILKAGFPMVVHNRSQAAVDELVAEGAIRASSPATVAAQVDIIFTNLPDSPDVEKVAMGERGIIEAAHDGLIVIDNSTIKPASARMIAAELAKKGVYALDAPVSGGDIGAKNGNRFRLPPILWSWANCSSLQRKPESIRARWWMRSKVARRSAGLWTSNRRVCSIAIATPASRRTCN